MARAIFPVRRVLAVHLAYAGQGENDRET